LLSVFLASGLTDEFCQPAGSLYRGRHDGVGGTEVLGMDAIRTGELSSRAVAMLRAVAAGRAGLTCSVEPDLYVDGLPCCDQFTARTLTRAGLIRPGRLGAIGQRVPATLTPAGHEALGGTLAAA
jgi:hypothetical protein